MSFTGFNLSNISDAYVGNTPVQEIYYGSTKLWPTSPQHDYSQDYLTFEALEPTTFTFSENALQYSLDNGSTWTTLAANTASPQLATGDKILWKQTGLTPSETWQHEGIGTFSATGNFKVYGNVMSLYYGDNFINKTTLYNKKNAFYRLFNTNNKLVNALNLILPATILSDSDSCYQYMFNGCTSLTTAPALPATTLSGSYSCYQYMFNGCTSLTTAPALPATTLAPQCYGSMFSGCTSLTTAPALPATSLLWVNCYANMFSGCTSLTTAPALPATRLSEHCYAAMFLNCTSLTTAPELPATTLEKYCYTYMFNGCTSLITAPELPATTLAYECYYQMFKGCTSLNYIKCLATNISASYCTTDWVSNVAASGTFVKNASMSSWTTGTSGIPSGWTIQNAS